MNPVDFLNVANRLHTSADEAERRTSISRSYYATYHVLVQALSAKHVQFERTGDDHGRLVHYLASSGDPRTQKIGGNLNTLRFSRADADYKLSKFMDVKASQLSFWIADRAIKSFNIIPAPDFENIVKAIKALPPYSPPS